MTSPSKLLDRYIIRLPDGLRDEIKKRAAANRRSMNQELLCLIELGMKLQSLGGGK